MSLRKDLVFTFSYLPEIEGLENNKIVLVTPLGLITGRAPTDSEIENTNNYNSALANCCNTTAVEYKQRISLSETDKLPGDEGYLYLVDVEIKSPHTTYNLPFMVVFFDQIIGISFGQS